MLTLIVAADKTTTKASSTTIWITTTVKGEKTAMQTPYEQSFKTTYSTAADEGDVKSGGIGLGSVSGNVGDVRSYEHTTVGQTNGAVGVFKSENLYSGIAGVSFLLLGALL